MEKKFLTILIVVGIVAFVLGGGLGMFLQQQQATSMLKPENNPKIKAVQLLSSKVVPSITAYGQVSNISGRNLTLTFGGDSLTVKIRDNATVFLPASTTTDSKGKQVTVPQKTVEFSEIKKGDNVSVNLTLSADGQMEGQMVVVLQAVK